jgi:hypothetical protein
MIRVPLAVTPNQTLAIVLGGQACQIALRQNGANMYFDLTVNNSAIVLSRICRNKQRLLLDVAYRGFVGDFLFNDTQGDTQPDYTGLDSRYLLYYVEAADLPV